jgi:hypothetical protein
LPAFFVFGAPFLDADRKSLLAGLFSLAESPEPR